MDDILDDKEDYANAISILNERNDTVPREEVIKIVFSDDAI